MAKAKAKAAARVVRFTAVLEPANNKLGWVIARVPKEAAEKLGGRGQIRVLGRIASAAGDAQPFAFRTTLFPDGRGGHYLLVNRAMQKGGRVKRGMPAVFDLRADCEPRTSEMPEELEQLLKQSRGLRRWFEESLNPSMQRESARWVATPKSATARQRRAGQLAERFMLTMEAERELPPVVRVALARNADAAAGWKRMPATKRRFHLLGIFGYRNPVTQQRRIEKAMQEAASYAGGDK